LPSPWRARLCRCKPVDRVTELVLLQNTAPIILRAVALIRLHQASTAAALVTQLRLLLRLLLHVSLR
jgi:hypothetical protein